MRGLAAFAVLLIHFCPFPHPIYDFAQLLIRFAVPFFFLISGYFFIQGVEARGFNQQTRQTLVRLSKLYGLWWLIYFLFPSSAEIRAKGFVGMFVQRWEKVSAGLETLVFYGPTTHLWFFPSLMCAVAASAFVLRFIPKNLGLVLAVIVYIVGVLGGSYSRSKIGIILPISARHLFFFSLLPFYAGVMLHKNQWKSLSAGLLLFCLGAIGHFFECLNLELKYGVPMAANDYVFSTVLMAVGAFFLSLEWQPRKNGALAHLGRLSGGIFLIHILILQRLPYLQPLFPAALWVWGAPFLAFGISACLVMGLQRLPILKKLFP